LTIARRFVEFVVVEAQRRRGLPLKARDEALLQPDRLVDGVVVALLRERQVFRRRRQHVLERVAFLDQLPYGLESEEAGIDKVSGLEASGESLLQNR
jgi:hypothetical protein